MTYYLIVGNLILFIISLLSRSAIYSRSNSGGFQSVTLRYKFSLKNKNVFSKIVYGKIENTFKSPHLYTTIISFFTVWCTQFIFLIIGIINLFFEFLPLRASMLILIFLVIGIMFMEAVFILTYDKIYYFIEKKNDTYRFEILDKLIARYGESYGAWDLIYFEQQDKKQKNIKKTKMLLEKILKDMTYIVINYWGGAQQNNLTLHSIILKKKHYIT